MKTELHIRGMKSESDATSIQQKLEETAGVHRASIDLDQGTVQVEFDSETVPIATLMKKVADLGYQASEGETRR